MKNFSIVALVGLVTVVFITGVALAQSGNPFQGTQAPQMKGSQQQFNALDTDHDGKVTKEDYMAYVDKLFKAIDEDGDDKVTKQDFMDHFEKVFKSMDANGDGVVTREEFEGCTSLIDCTGDPTTHGMRK